MGFNVEHGMYKETDGNLSESSHEETGFSRLEQSTSTIIQGGCECCANMSPGDRQSVSEIIDTAICHTYYCLLL